MHLLFEHQNGDRNLSGFFGGAQQRAPLTVNPTQPDPNLEKVPFARKLDPIPRGRVQCCATKGSEEGEGYGAGILATQSSVANFRGGLGEGPGRLGDTVVGHVLPIIDHPSPLTFRPAVQQYSFKIYIQYRVLTL